MSEQAEKTIFGLKCSPVFNEIPPHLKIHIFDVKVLPVLLYGAEVWGDLNHNFDNQVDQVHVKFCKYILGLPPYCINEVALGEFGRLHISLFAAFRKIKYWLRILRHDNIRYTSVCYKQSLQMANNDAICWAGQVKKILCTTRYGDVWLTQNTDDDNSFL